MLKLLLPYGTPSFVNTEIWRPHLQKHFELVHMDKGDSLSDYNPKEHIYIQSHAVDAVKEAEQVLSAGFKMILDYMWDHHGSSILANNVMLLKSNDFIVANEILAYKYFGYENLNFVQDKKRFLLCLMHQIREHRDRLFANLEEYKQDSLISYVERGHFIAGDRNKDDEGTYVGAPVWERYVNVDWYTNTNFSVVAETDAWRRDFISEKSFKPFAFRHPLIVYGPYKILKRIRSVGFETFDNIIDESYDTVLYQVPRMEAIKKELDRLYKDFKSNSNMFTDPETEKRIEHNYNHFYSDNLLNDIIDNQIVKPIMEFACQAY